MCVLINDLAISFERVELPLRVAAVEQRICAAVLFGRYLLPLRFSPRSLSALCVSALIVILVFFYSQKVHYNALSGISTEKTAL
jgi:hypothetical protein